MGWYFGWSSRKNVADSILKDEKIIAHAFRGNNLWVVWELLFDGSLTRIVSLFMLQRSGKDWGYKEVGEDMGPWQVNCPMTLFKLVENYPPVNQWSADWREKVKEYHALMSRPVEVGMKIRFNDIPYLIVAVEKSRLIIAGATGMRYRFPRSRMSELVF